MDARGVIVRLLQAGQGGRVSPPADVRAPNGAYGASPASPEQGPVEEPLPGQDGPTETAAEPTTAVGPVIAPAAEPEPTAELDDPERRRRLEAATEVAEAFGLGFHLGGAVERIAAGAAAGSDGLESLREAAWLIERYVVLVEERPEGADIHQASLRLTQTGEVIAEMKALSAALAQERAAHTEPVVAVGSTPPGAPSPPLNDSPPGADAHGPPPSLAREIALSAARWALLVGAVIVLVLALTLIGQWR